MQLITENTTIIKATLPERDPTKKQEVFYNPLMKSNRNISILLLNSIENENMNLALPLTGSGIRGLRFLKELKTGKINQLFVNDIKENFLQNFNDNLKLNKLTKKKININNDDANLFLLNQVKHPESNFFCGYFDYIDLDPFGTPNPFLSAAIARITRKGILAMSATDTAALTGTYPKVTKRKYWSISLKNHLMHETGLRILIRKVQLQGAQFDKALTPILAYHKDHYFRIYFRSEKGKEKCDLILKQHQYFLLNPKTLEFKTSTFNQERGFQTAGPLWIGKLFDKTLLKKMVKNNPFPEEEKFLSVLNQEKDFPGFYDLHAIGKKYKSAPVKLELALKTLKGTRTHFSKYGVKTKKNIKDVIFLLKNEKETH